MHENQSQPENENAQTHAHEFNGRVSGSDDHVRTAGVAKLDRASERSREELMASFSGEENTDVSDKFRPGTPGGKIRMAHRRSFEGQ